MNVGPGSDGTIEPIFQERLRQVRSWERRDGGGEGQAKGKNGGRTRKGIYECLDGLVAGSKW